MKKSIARYSGASLYDWSGIDDAAIAEIVGEFYKEKCQGFSGAEISALVGNVVESSFREFMSSEENQKNFASDKAKIKINKKVFIKLVESIRPYAMSNQLNNDKKDSAINRIKKLQEDFNIKPASKKY